MKFLLIIIGLFYFSSLAQGKSYIPQDPQQIIATWDKSESYKNRKSEIKTPLQDTDSLLALAQKEQHQHRFSAAQALLQKIIAREPHNINANLMIARLSLVQGNPQAALTACLRLFGRTDLLTLSACSLEARSVLGKTELEQSFLQLKNLYNTQISPDDERQAWILQMLSDMAMQLNNPQEALYFLENIKINKTLSVWIQWADVNIALKNYQEILNQLSTLDNIQTEDGLLIRLAIAEKQLTNDTAWRDQLQPHIALREARDDQAHAADLAIYYLDVLSDPRKALYWAEHNWQQAREAKDKQLLARAQQAVVQLTTAAVGEQ